MSTWGDMLDRGAGERNRKEDEFKTPKIIKNRYSDSDTVIWKGYLGDDTVVDEDIPNEIDNFRWDPYKSSRKAFESSYIIDHFELL